jgi:RNA polymerase sigma-70 factor (family 1)
MKRLKYIPEDARAGSAFPINRKEFEGLYREHWRELYDFAVAKTHDKDVAEEIVQALFVSIWEKRDQLLISNLRSYLFVSVRNRIIDHYKERIFSDLTSASDTSAPDYPLFLDELESTFREAMGQLPEKTRDIFLLNRIEGKSASEIADKLQLPSRTVEYHITQALRKLREILRNGITALLFFINIIF